jgi:DNA-binding transcriptional ArsR family regulator
MNGHQQMAVFMKALGHPTRLQILEVLAREGESCVCHLEHRLGQRQANISQQLARLRDARLVVDRRDGLNVFYDLADASIEDALKIARQTAVVMAKARGESIVFREVIGDPFTACPCPKCQVTVGEAVGENKPLRLTS